MREVKVTMRNAPVRSKVLSIRGNLAVIGAAAALLMGHSSAQAQQKEAGQAVTAPSVAEIRANAEEGFIYGLPLVMNYAAMYDIAIDKNSGQFLAPFNHLKNEARVYTYKDTAVVTPNSDTPYSVLWLDLSAEPIVLSVPAVKNNSY
jgi:hypothetical protein